MKKRNNLGMGVAFALTFGFLLTGCSANPEPVPAPTTAVVETAKPSASTPVETTKPTAKPSASTEAEFTAEAKEVAKKQEETPLGIDRGAAIRDWSTPEVKALVNSGVDVDAAMEAGLSVYQDLLRSENFYIARDASNDFELLVNVEKYTNRIEAGLLAKIESEAKLANQMTRVFATDKNASFSYVDKKEKKHTFTATGMPMSDTFNTPAVAVDEEGAITINGFRTMVLPTKTGNYQFKMPYRVKVKAINNDTFLVTDLAWAIPEDGVTRVSK